MAAKDLRAQGAGQSVQGLSEVDIAATASHGKRGLFEVGAAGTRHESRTISPLAPARGSSMAPTTHPRLGRRFRDLAAPAGRAAAQIATNGFKTFIVSGAGST